MQEKTRIKMQQEAQVKMQEKTRIKIQQEAQVKMQQNTINNKKKQLKKQLKNQDAIKSN